MRGDGAVFKHPRSKFLWIRYSHRGKLYRETTGTVDPKKAAKLLKQKLAGIAADKHGIAEFVPNSQLRVRDLLDALEADYKLREVRSVPQVQAHRKPLLEILGGIRAQDLGSEAIDRYIEKRLQAGKAKATVNRETRILGQAFRLAIQRKKLRTAPIIRRLSEKGNRREGFFEANEFEAVLSNLPDYLNGFTHFGYLSGWRKGEIASLQCPDVDLMGKVIRLRPGHSKNGCGRVLALEAELWEIVERQWRMREYQKPDGTAGLSLYIFQRDGAPIGDIRKAWATACKKAGVKKLFHDFRRTAARNMRRAGVPEDVVMKVLGHKTRSMLARYDIVNEGDIREAVLRTQQYLRSVPPQQTVVPFQKEAAGGVQ